MPEGEPTAALTSPTAVIAAVLLLVVIIVAAFALQVGDGDDAEEAATAQPLETGYIAPEPARTRVARAAPVLVVEQMPAIGVDVSG